MLTFSNTNFPPPSADPPPQEEAAVPFDDSPAAPVAKPALPTDSEVTAEKTMPKMKKRIVHFGESDMQPKYDNAGATLQKLLATKLELEEDFHRKLVSLKIDECCRKITPEKCTGQKPEEMPVATILELTAKKKMGRTTSSPTFAGMDATSSLRPTSPAGVSSALKNAARVSISIA